MSSKQGSLFGGILLIAGSCIGAGMLALPILTGLAGFFPSLVMFFCAWAFMTTTALLMVEANGWFKEQVNIISMAEKAFGKMGAAVAWLLYLFLFYSLLVAYISGSGSLSATYSSTYLSADLPNWWGSFFFVLLFGSIAYLGTRAVDHWNRLLVFAKIGAYLGMVFLGVAYVKPHMLFYAAPSYAIFSLPVLIISFGFHNMIPTLTAYLNGDLKRVRIAILAGSLSVLGIYLIWEIIVLGIVPTGGEWGLINSWKLGRQASDSVAGFLGISWVSSFAEGLAFFALLSSFLAQTLALVHFLADGFKIKSKKHESIGLCAAALGPPLLFSLIYPELFIKALNFAGGICAVILFGALPALMVWKGRYIQKISSPYQVGGGKVALIAVLFVAAFVLFFQLSNMAGAPYIPRP